MSNKLDIDYVKPNDFHYHQVALFQSDTCPTVYYYLMVVELESSCTIKSVTAKQKIDATDHKCSVALEFGRWLVLQRSFILNIAC